MEKFINFKDKGLTGLVNLGNTCYINSCLQALSHCYELSEYLNNNFENDFETKLNNIPGSILIIEWNKLRKLMWSQNCIVAPHGFLKATHHVATVLKRDLFTGFAQNDIHEFLLFLIDSFHDSIKRDVEINIKGKVINNKDKLAVECFKMIKKMYSNNYSELLDLFYGIQVTKITSISNDVISANPEPFCVISLPLINNKKETTLIECFKLYCENEFLSGENAYYNENKKEKENVYKSTVFWNLPNILIIDLKRYDNFLRKINTHVDIPIDNLDLRNFVCGYDNNNLFAVCNHHGNCNGGHYTSCIKNANNKWYLYNDSVIQEIKQDKVISQSAYTLFYRIK
jgi:ubiquitin C-terminal hydrolase